jgi:hypothetical protein
MSDELEHGSGWTDPKEDKLSMTYEPSDIERRLNGFAEGQSRFMRGVFDIVNEANGRVLGLEQRVLWLEKALRGLLTGGAGYDARDTGTHSVHPSTTIIARNDRSGQDSPREASHLASARGEREGDPGSGD